MITFWPDPHAPIRVASPVSLFIAVHESRHLRRSDQAIDLLWAALHLAAAVEWLEHQAVHCPGPRRRAGRRVLSRAINAERQQAMRDLYLLLANN